MWYVSVSTFSSQLQELEMNKELLQQQLSTLYQTKIELELQQSEQTKLVTIANNLVSHSIT